MTTHPFPPDLSPRHAPLPSGLALRTSTLSASKIREVSEEGAQMAGVLPLWFGEGAWPTDPIAVEAAAEALRAGDHFYHSNRGAPPLRAAIAGYLSALHGRPVPVERITVSASGMQGLALVAQALVTPGDRVVTLRPAWPNIAETFRIAGAEIHFEGLEPKEGRWSLDMTRLLAAVTPDTRAVVLNSPHNPTGWVMPEADMKTLLEHCRKLGTWIVSDDVYARLYRHGQVAPAFPALADEGDRVISVNSFSKAWSMTGWRLGWITAPEELAAPLGMLTEFNMSCTPGFVQAAGAAMLDRGEAAVATFRGRLTEAYALTSARLRALPGIDFLEPDGAFYCFFKVEGMGDSLATAKALLRVAQVGLAPGIAFGEEGEGYLRLCYAQPVEVLERALARLGEGLLTARR
ncbi:MAG: pyridoxal phosphate-dependent aminotransferase [Rhodospirillum sp.]|nr:pyridoxal phosphate-dependent aminotransferase [Rhodospirillum sp.]MCF8488291.1 pyridoxal phosphate-dependent aminotransferase [Rhodospirillum sp.]